MASRPGLLRPSREFPARHEERVRAAIIDFGGFLGGNAYAGRDLNGDGDKLDQVTVVAPSQTHTDRYGVIAGLRASYPATIKPALQIIKTRPSASTAML